MKRFLRKWVRFKHSSDFDETSEYKYNISLNIYNLPPNDTGLIHNYYLFNKIYIANIPIDQFKQEYNRNHTPANTLLNISSDQWSYYKKYYRTWEFDDIFVNDKLTSDDVIYTIDVKNQPFIDFILSTNKDIYINNQDFIHSIRQESPGEYELEDYKLNIKINRIENHIKDELIVKNPSIDDIKFEEY